MASDENREGRCIMKRFFAVLAAVLGVLVIGCAAVLLVSEIFYPGRGSEAVRPGGEKGQDDPAKGKEEDGRYFSVLGDSVSAYRGCVSRELTPYYSSGDFSVESMWWSVLGEETGMEPCVINAGSGTGVTELFPDEGFPTAGNSERCEQLHTEEHTPDVIFVLLGGNDAIQQVPGSELEDAYVEMLERMRQAYPDAEIYACTYYLMPGFLTEPIRDLNERIRRAASEADVPCIDVEGCAVSTGDPEEYLLDYDAASDFGVHVNEKGQRVLGEAVADGMKESGKAPGIQTE